MLLSDPEIKKAMAECKTIAVVGAKDKPGSAVDMVGRYLIKAGYTVYPVHPVRKNIWDLPTYPTLGDVPDDVQIVNLFRAADYCPAHAREALARNPLPKVFWMQSGIFSYESRTLLAESKMLVVEDRCIMVEHRRLLGPS